MLYDDEFDFGALLDDDFLFSGEDFAANHESSSPPKQRSARQASVKIRPVKSAGGAESVPRMRRKIYRPREGRVDNNAAVNSIQCRQYLRRRSTGSCSGDFKLYAFPTFDKCDSLLFFPTTIAAICNSGDIPALSKLMYSRAAKDCKVNVNVISAEDMSVKAYIKMQELVIELHPDIILCVHTTRVEGNEIRASAVLKFTASKALYTAMSRLKSTAVFSPYFSVDRAEGLRHIISREDIPHDESVYFHSLLDTDLDLVIHKRTEMVLTFDDTTKKLTRLSIKCRLTAIEVITGPVEEVD